MYCSVIYVYDFTAIFFFSIISSDIPNNNKFSYLRHFLIATKKPPYIIDQFILLLYFWLVRIHLAEFNQIDDFSLFSITPFSRVLYRFQIWSIPDIFFFSKWKFFIFLPMIHFFLMTFYFLLFMFCVFFLFSFNLITFIMCLLCYSMRHLRFQTIYSKHIENQINFILKCHCKHVIK